MKSAESTVTVHVPMAFTIRGGRKEIISDVREALAGSSPRTGNALLKALARAHRWRRMIEEGHYDSITDLAKATGVNESYACRLLRMTLLAPSIVAEILDGRCAEVTLNLLSKPFPVNWDLQFSEFRMRPLVDARPSRNDCSRGKIDAG